MLNAIAAIAVAVIAGLVTLSSSALSQRRDRREREAIRDEIAMLPTIPSEQARQLFADHLKRRVMLYVQFENTRRKRRSGVAMAVCLFIMSALLVFTAVAPEEWMARKFSESPDLRYMLPGYILYVIGLWFLFSSFGPMTRKSKAVQPKAIKLPPWIAETYSLPMPDVLHATSRRRFGLFRR